MSTTAAKRRAVKPRRRYDATARRARALQAQRAIVDAAERLFVRDGFQGTTIAAVAARAGVSAETIYKTFGGKTGLVRAIRERGLGGDGPVRAERRSNALQREERDPRRIIEGWGRLTIEVAPKVMPILQLVAAAAPATRRWRGCGKNWMSPGWKGCATTRRGSPARAACAKGCGRATPPMCCGPAVRQNCTSCSSAAAAGRRRAMHALSRT
jgi:AcrR family transcriptional regulator